MKTITQFGELIAARITELMCTEENLLLELLQDDMTKFAKLDVNELSKNYDSWAEMVTEMNESSSVVKHVFTAEEFASMLVVLNDEPSMRAYYEEFVVPVLNENLNEQLAELAETIAS